MVNPPTDLPEEISVPADQPAFAPTRRKVLQVGATVTIAGATVTVLGGCGGKAAEAPSGLRSLTEQASQTIATAVTNNEVPVGEAKVFNDAGIILSHPEKDRYLAFSDLCTHQAAKITRISSRGNLHCVVHGSEFDPVTGDVKVGPANKGLTPREVQVEGSTARLA